MHILKVPNISDSIQNHDASFYFKLMEYRIEEDYTTYAQGSNIAIGYI